MLSNSKPVQDQRNKIPSKSLPLNTIVHPIFFSIIIIITLISIPLISSRNCEESPQHCTCSMKDTLEYLNKASVISRSVLSRAPDAVSQRIKSFQCQKYEQLPQTLVIKGSEIEDEYRMNRRLRRRLRSIFPSNNRQRQMLRSRGSLPLPPMRSFRNVRISMREGSQKLKMDENFKNKKRRRQQRQIPLGYPSNELFQEVIPRLPDRSLHRYVPLGAQAILPCVGPQDVIEGNAWIERRFRWTHSSGRSVSASEMEIDKSSGNLTLKAVQLSDSDVYNCTVTYYQNDEDSEELQTLSYSQQLDVVAEPIAWLKFSLTYSTESCDHDEMVLIQENIVKWVHQYVCFFCPVRNNSVSCVFKGEGQESAYQDVKIRLAISTIGMEKRMTTFQSYSEACPLPCIESLHLKIIQIIRNSLEKLFSLEINIEAAQDKTSVYSPQLDTIDSDLAIGCPSGFFENYKLCFPCPAGEYSPNGNSDCSKCPIGHYQPTPGSAICFPCPQGYATFGVGSLAEFDCKIELFANLVRSSSANWLAISLTILGFLTPILLLICLIPYFCPNTFLGRWFACLSICSDNPDPDLGDRPKTSEEKEKRSSTSSRRGSGSKQSQNGGKNPTTTNGYSKVESAEETDQTNTTTDNDDDEHEVLFKPISDRRRIYNQTGFSSKEASKSMKDDQKNRKKETKTFVFDGKSLSKVQKDEQKSKVSKVPQPPPLPVVEKPATKDQNKSVRFLGNKRPPPIKPNPILPTSANESDEVTRPRVNVKDMAQKFDKRIWSNDNQLKDRSKVKKDAHDQNCLYRPSKTSKTRVKGQRVPKSKSKLKLGYG